MHPARAASLPPVRYLVLIDAAQGPRLARLYLASREAVAEFDASAPEVQLMLRGLAPSSHADAAAWDQALRQHSAAERARAEVYALDA